MRITYRASCNRHTQGLRVLDESVHHGELGDAEHDPGRDGGPVDAGQAHGGAPHDHHVGKGDHGRLDGRGDGERRGEPSGRSSQASSEEEYDCARGLGLTERRTVGLERTARRSGGMRRTAISVATRQRRRAITLRRRPRRQNRRRGRRKAPEAENELNGPIEEIELQNAT